MERNNEQAERLHPSSAGKALDWSPKKWRHYLDTRREPTAAMVLGSAVHSLVLGGQEVVELPGSDLRRKDAKEANRLALEDGHLPLKPKDYATALSAADAVTAAIQARFPSALWTPETTLRWDSNGVPCEGTPDLVLHDEFPATVIELKTCADLSKFARQVVDMHYDCQAAAYLEAIASERGAMYEHLFLAVEMAAPYCCGWFQLDEDGHAVGQVKWDTAVGVFKACNQSGKWPGPAPEIIETKPWTRDRWLA